MKTKAEKKAKYKNFKTQWHSFEKCRIIFEFGKSS